ncbi:MAG: hypothetical protein A2Y58_05155 [Chloroflexi bacterium RBG_13_51_52]|nr:MAG: hypothetical protein A2Y58_05155 [Chloroflexi bacterium RBG_13_51_52]
MKPLQTDLSIFNKLKLERPPVGVKYLFQKPEGIQTLGKSLALCEMLKEAQKRDAPFYFTKKNENCFGKQTLGMVGDGSPPFAESGELGVKLEIFQDARANKRLVRQNYGLGKGTVNYVAMAPLDKINFEPDLLILMTTARQGEIVMRAMAYSTGEIYESKTSTALSCSWLYAYPYLSGKINYFITGMGFGAIGREAFPPGWVLISIPYNWLATIVSNLKEMKWELTAYTLGREKFIKWEKGILKELAREFQNP